MGWIKNLRLIMSAISSMSSKLGRKADKSEVEKRLSTKADKSSVSNLASKAEVRNKVDYTKIAREWDEESSYSRGSMVTRNGKFYVAYRDFPPDFGWDDKDWEENRVAPYLIKLVQDEERARNYEREKFLTDIVGGTVYTGNWPSLAVKGQFYLVSKSSIHQGEIRLYKCIQSYSGDIYDWNYTGYLQNMTIAEALRPIEADEVYYDSSKVYTAGNVGYEIQNLRRSLVKRGSVVVRSHQFNTGTMVAIYADPTTLDFTDQDTVMIFASTDTTGDSYIGFYCDDVHFSMGRYWISVGARNNVTRDVTFNFVIIKGIPGKPVIAGY